MATRKCYAPIILFSYNRPEHLEKVIRALRANNESQLTDLYIYCDGPKSLKEKYKCDKVFEIASSVKGFRSLKVVRNVNNSGLARSIISGVSEVLKLHESAIIVEDDILVSRFFLKYINDGLRVYKDDGRVAAIHGYTYPIDKINTETFFIKGADCWGWGTWRRAWAHFDEDGSNLLNQILKRGLAYEFDMNGSYPYTKMLRDQVLGKNQSWAIRWQASTFLKDMYTLYPSKSMVQNIGHDDSGTHSGYSKEFDVEICDFPLRVEKKEVKNSDDEYLLICKYYKDLRWLPGRIKRFIHSRFLRIASLLKSKK